MALPNDMQIVPVVLLKSDIAIIDELRKRQRLSRSEFLRNMIASKAQALFLKVRSSEETNDSRNEQADATKELTCTTSLPTPAQ